MTPEELATLIRATLLDAAAAGRISIDPSLVPDPVTVERPRVREHGDWATNVAMQLGKKAGMAPREFAQILADDLAAADGIDSVEVAGPGFINIRLGAGAAGELARTIVEAGAAYGRNETLSGRSSTSLQTRPAPCTWAAPAGQPSVTLSPASWPPPAPP